MTVPEVWQEATMIPTDPLSNKTIFCIERRSGNLVLRDGASRKIWIRSSHGTFVTRRLKLAITSKVDAVLLEYEMEGLMGTKLPPK
jgi:hypothetical protein